MDTSSFEFGLIGLGVMGRNFLLNMADHGFRVAGYNRTPEKATLVEKEAGEDTVVMGVSSIDTFVKVLKKPRIIMMLVPAGMAVDDLIEQLTPRLDEGDIIIDGGNSHFTDTLRRVDYLKRKGLHFMGMGVSGGEEGARRGPSIMPGGDKEAWEAVKPMLEAASAKVKGDPCVAYMGKGAAGHYVKMVHNGIEYAIMQLISEIYQLLHEGLGLNNDELHQVFKEWNEGELQSFLVEITRDIFLQKDDKSDNRLVDMILDEAGSKGTGKWTSQSAMDLHYPIPTIDMAVSMRDLSSYKRERTEIEKIYGHPKSKIDIDKKVFIEQAHDALFFGMVNCYAQGMGLLFKASREMNMDIPLADVVRIWRGGCIIRSSFLETLCTIYQKDGQLENPLMTEEIAKLLKPKEENVRNITAVAIQNGFPVAGLSTALAYFDSFRRKHLPVNLIQAQRDYFGSHTYKRIDEEGSFHTQWSGSAK